MDQEKYECTLNFFFKSDMCNLEIKARIPKKDIDVLKKELERALKDEEHKIICLYKADGFESDTFIQRDKIKFVSIK